MKPLELKIFPDPCLRNRVRSVEKFTPELSEVLRSMSDVMYVNEGIGLAASQVGLDLNILIIDTGEGKKNFINPQILEKSKKRSAMKEGCLSLPYITVNVSRPEQVRVRAQNERGEFFDESFDGLMARAVQHEIDHLEGRLIIDYLDPLRYFLATRKLTGIKRRQDAEIKEAA